MFGNELDPKMHKSRHENMENTEENTEKKKNREQTLTCCHTSMRIYMGSPVYAHGASSYTCVGVVHTLSDTSLHFTLLYFNSFAKYKGL